MDNEYDDHSNNAVVITGRKYCKFAFIVLISHTLMHFFHHLMGTHSLCQLLSYDKFGRHLNDPTSDSLEPSSKGTLLKYSSSVINSLSETNNSEVGGDAAR